MLKKWSQTWAVLLCLITPITTNAAVVANIYEDGSDLIVSYSGSLNLDATAGKEATRNFNLNLLAGSLPGQLLSYNHGNEKLDDYNLVADSIERPTTSLFFGQARGGTTSGDVVHLEIGTTYGQMWIYEGYVSGTAFSGSTTYANTSMASMGANFGTYLWSWSNGDETDSLTVNIIEPSRVPLPAGGLLLLTGLGGVVVFKRRKTRAA